MTAVASTAADLALICEQLRRLESLQAGWQGLSAEFGQTAARARHAHTEGRACGEELAKLGVFDRALTNIENSAVDALSDLIGLVESLGNA